MVHLLDRRAFILPLRRTPCPVIPIEFNFLLNPDHDDFRGFPVHGPRPLDVDPRVFQRVE